MRTEPIHQLDEYRKDHPSLGSTGKGTNYGFFMRGPLRIISSGDRTNNGWEHVSVSCADRCPTWDEMCQVKNMFWEPLETVIQFHPSQDNYVNNMRYCLHLWKRTNMEYELPPKNLIGV